VILTGYTTKKLEKMLQKFIILIFYILGTYLVISYFYIDFNLKNGWVGIGLVILARILEFVTENKNK